MPLACFVGQYAGWGTCWYWVCVSETGHQPVFLVTVRAHPYVGHAAVFFLDAEPGVVLDYVIAVMKAASMLDTYPHQYADLLVPVAAELWYHHPEAPTAEVLASTIQLGRDTILVNLGNVEGQAAQPQGPSAHGNNVCRRCGRPGHYIRTCRANSDVNGNRLAPRQQWGQQQGYNPQQQGYNPQGHMVVGGANAQPLGPLALPAPH